MARGRVEQVLVRTAGGRRPDRVAAEEPLEIRLDGVVVATTMRTPGHDFELAAGFCRAEGLLGGAPVAEVRYCATGSAVETGFNVVSVDTGGAAPAPQPRLTTTTAACGVCGAEQIDALVERLAPIASPVPADDALVRIAVGVPDRVRAQQDLFDATGSVHAAAAFDLATGEPKIVREDVGRHNAIDKVVGRLLLDGALPVEGLGLATSGRVSFEVVQKAWAAGFPVVVAVGGPTSLAVSTARRADITLIAFVRGGAANVYAEPEVRSRP